MIIQSPDCKNKKMILDSDEFLFHQCNTHFHILIGHSHRTYCHMRRQSIPQYKHSWTYLAVIHLHTFHHFDKALIDFTKNDPKLTQPKADPTQSWPNPKLTQLVADPTRNWPDPKLTESEIYPEGFEPNREITKSFRWTKMNTFVEIIATSFSFPARVAITKVTPVYIFANSMLTGRTGTMISSHMMQFFFMLFTVRS